MTPRRIVAVCLVTQEELQRLGDEFERAWPIDETPCFEGLLQAIDERIGSCGENGTRRSALGGQTGELWPIGVGCGRFNRGSSSHERDYGGGDHRARAWADYAVKIINTLRNDPFETFVSSHTFAGIKPGLNCYWLGPPLSSVAGSEPTASA